MTPLSSPSDSPAPSTAAPLPSRPPTPADLAAIPWLNQLPLEDATAAAAVLAVVDVPRGALVCSAGGPVQGWLGVVRGLLKIETAATAGVDAPNGLPPGGWFGEAALLRGEGHWHDVRALRDSVVAILPAEAFGRLLEQSLGFNRFLLQQLGARLRAQERAGEADPRAPSRRAGSPDLRVAHALASLFDRALHPGVGSVVQVTQQELAQLLGLSRQRVNEALNLLQSRGAIETVYGGVRARDVRALQTFAPNATD